LLRECSTGQLPVLKSPRFDVVHMHFFQRWWSSWLTNWYRGCATHDGGSDCICADIENGFQILYVARSSRMEGVNDLISRFIRKRVKVLDHG
jgi:hypothetical protein